MIYTDVNAKLDSEVVKDAKIVAAARDVTMAEYLSELLRPLVRRDLRSAMSDRLNTGTEAAPRKARKPKGGE